MFNNTKFLYLPCDGSLFLYEFEKKNDVICFVMFISVNFYFRPQLALEYAGKVSVFASLCSVYTKILSVQGLITICTVSKVHYHHKIPKIWIPKLSLIVLKME